MEDKKEKIIPKKNFWVLTNNYLKTFKGFFETRQAVDDFLLDHIVESKVWYKKELKKKRDDEIASNNRSKGSLKYKVRNKNQLAYETFVDYSEEELTSSINVLNLKDLDEESKRMIFFSDSDKKYSLC